MDEVVTEENRKRALDAVTRNKGAAGIDRMTTKELENHLQTHWEKIRAKLLDGTYVPSPGPEVEIDGQACHLTSAHGATLRGQRVEIPKPGGGTRMLGIPTVQDRFIQQLLMQGLTPIFDPEFSEHSYGFRPGRKAQDAVRAAQKYAREGKDWVVDIDITKFFDHVNHDILMGRIAQVIRDKRVLHLIGKFLRRGAMVDGVVTASVEGTPDQRDAVMAILSGDKLTCAATPRGQWPAVSAAGQHLPGCARQGTGQARATVLPACR